jgi:GGDEF domain-containing protein
MGPMKLTLARKMLLGFSLMIVLMVITGSYAVLSLRELKALNDRVVRRDLPTIEAATAMTESLLAQDLYHKRYRIMREQSVADLFRGRGREFGENLRRLRALAGDTPTVAKIRMLHHEYQRLFEQEVETLALKREPTRALADELLKERFDALLLALRQLETGARTSQNATMREAHRVSQGAFRTTLAFCVIGFGFGVGFAIRINASFARSIRKLQEAADHISQGHFDRALDVNAPEEVRELAESFRFMSRRLKELEEIRLDANPLTRLPGNVAIERALLVRLQEGKPFAFSLIDIDNFKPFGDYYGYARGSGVLKRVAEILVFSVRAAGEPSDFVGHIGGDDFVIISVPERIDALCQKIISEFDSQVPLFYDEEDRRRGFIIARDRRDVEQHYPVMTISIAVVTNQMRSITSPVQVAQVAAQLKQYAKTFPRSVYIVDQRRAG